MIFVLANEFTPIIRPSVLLSLDQSVPLHSQIASSLPIINKMSVYQIEISALPGFLYMNQK